MLKLTQQEFTSLPQQLTFELLISVALCLFGKSPVSAVLLLLSCCCVSAVEHRTCRMQVAVFASHVLSSLSSDAGLATLCGLPVCAASHCHKHPTALPFTVLSTRCLTVC